MKIAIHQPHYFPWIGYFDKIAKADKFILLDQVQFEKSSSMVRNRVLSDAGEIKYITISADTKNFLEREYRDIAVKDASVWKTRQRNALRSYYRNADFADEILNLLNTFWKNDFLTLCEWTCESIRLICELFDIQTERIYQSRLPYREDIKRSDLVLYICQAVQADCYFSGRGGSIKYLDLEKFKASGMDVEFQDFQSPIYKQCSSEAFVPGISILDMLFNCGIKEAKRLFWENIKRDELL